MNDMSCNQVLSELGYDKRETGANFRVDIFKGETCMLENVSCHEVWEWLQSTNQI